MARYLAVAAVRKEGRRIAGDGTAQPPAVAQGERLIAIVNNGEWQSAIDVTFPVFYDRIYRRYFTSPDTLPARTRIQAGRMPMDCGLEVEAIGYVPTAP